MGGHVGLPRAGRARGGRAGRRLPRDPPRPADHAPRPLLPRPRHPAGGPRLAWRPAGDRVSDGEFILVAGALLAAGIGASLLAGRLRVPGLLFVLAIGMVLGSDGTGWIEFDDYELAQTVG